MVKSRPDAVDADLLVTAIVVTHVGPSDLLQRCLTSIADSGGVDAVMVVDNSPRSQPDQPDVENPIHTEAVPIVTAVEGHPHVETIVVENRGFGAAVNAGVRAAARRASASGEVVGYFAVLNDDVTVQQGWVEPLVAEIAANERVGGVQPKMLLAGTDPALINSVGVELDAAGAGSDIGMGQPDGPDFAQVTDIAIFSGGAVLLSAVFLAELGGFDERYFLYYEDVDLALRGGERGWRFRCIPDSTVRHEGSATTKTLGNEVRRLQERNRLWVAFRFGSAHSVARALWLSVRRLRHEPRRVHARALAAGISGASSRLIERRRANSLSSE